MRHALVPHWIAIVRRHTMLLELTWPDRIDAFLVPVSYELRGGYSHPLTISASANQGLALCETLLHEATHVADVHGIQSEHPCLGRALMDRLRAKGLSFQNAFNIWHAVIFAASADGIRYDIDPEYGDYALQDRDLYAILGAPRAPDLWRRYAANEMTRDDFLAALVDSI